jgi:hypothetical protein
METPTVETTSSNMILIEYTDNDDYWCDLSEGTPETPNCSELHANIMFTHTVDDKESDDHNYTCYTHMNEKLAELLECELQGVPKVLIIDDVDADGLRANFKAVGGELWNRMTIIEKPLNENI